jgi:CHU_C Type IX secretion signal domain/Ig-like domain CHU_C associated/Laminin B (Domain IV)
MGYKKIILSIIGAAVLWVANGQTVVVSDFPTTSVGVDGWTAPQALANAISYSATGGNPNGFVAAFPTSGGTIAVFPVYFYFNAPAKFRGNLSSYYNGNLSFDLQQNTLTTATAFAEVVISDGTNSIYYFPFTPFNPPAPVPPAPPTWGNFSVPLNELSGAWKTSNSSTGTTATQANIQAILSNVTYLGIRGRFNAASAPGATRLDNVFLQPPITITSQPSSTSGCVGSVITLSTVATGNNNLSYQWYIFNPSFGQYTSLANSSVYSNVTSPTLSIAASGTAGAGTYLCTISGSNGAASVNTNTATVTVNALPSPPTATGASICGSGTVTLTATSGSAGSFLWYANASGGTSLTGKVTGNFTTPTITTTTTYYVSFDNSLCESTRTAAVATINSVPSNPTAPTVSVCTNSTATLTASGGAAGQYRWYLVATGGVPISGQTSNTFITPSLMANAIYYVAINNGLCESGRQAVNVSVSAPPAVSSVTNASGCLPFASVTLSAAGGSNGQYRWYTVASGGTAIVGETNSNYTTPSLSATTSYYVSINNGICESARILVTASIVPVPNIPTATGATGCPNTAFTLNATGASNGQYRWYTTASGGNAITGEVNSNFTTPSLAVSTNYYVAISNNICESTRVIATATVDNTGCTPPTIATRPLATPVGGIITLNLIPLILTPNSSLDINSIQITIPPLSGAVATINKGELILNYKGIAFTGTEQLTIRACNINGSCATQLFKIDVAGDIVVYNALSPNGANPKFTIEFIDLIPEAKSNIVTIFDRWQNEVWRGENYDNTSVVFRGIGDGGNDLPTGTYFYKIEFTSGKKMRTGFISLKR